MRAHLERDFSNYLRKEHVEDAATGRQSFWKTYDLLVGIIGAAATRELVKQALEVPAEARPSRLRRPKAAAEDGQSAPGANSQAQLGPARQSRPAAARASRGGGR